jgi:DNA repair exonuclease SbcCD nuclease subunit
MFEDNTLPASVGPVLTGQSAQGKTEIADEAQGGLPMADAIKFIHAADFHLDQPIRGLTELPAHLRSRLANAPYDAAGKVFDLAIAERVDFVLLTGDLFDIESGSARAYAFLLSEFQRLAEKNIHIYWCGGEFDFPDRWPSSVALPDNVITFSSSIIDEIEHRRDGKRICAIFASGYDCKRGSLADFDGSESATFNIAMTYGQFEASHLTGPNIHYWALGGVHKATTLEKTQTLGVYPGTPQGRRPQESGARGFKLCRVDAKGKLRVQTVETDSVRFIPQKLTISENVSMKSLKETLTERGMKLISDCPDQLVLTRWYLATEGEFNPRIRKVEWAAELLEWLRDEFGRGEDGVWSTEVKVEAPKSLPSNWYEEDTILGEYMRAVARYQSDDSLKLNLHQYMPQTIKGDAMANVGYVNRDSRDAILRKTGMIGIEYLAAHKEVAEAGAREIDLGIEVE